MTFWLAIVTLIAQPTPEAPAPPPLPLAHLPIVLWSDGEVLARPGSGAAPSTPVIGDALDVAFSLELATNGRVALLADGERLVVLRGPGFWRMGEGALETVTGDAPRVEALAPYREGPLPTLEGPLSQPLDDDLGLAATLAWDGPAGPVVRRPPMEARWHWPHLGGRFDLTITRLASDGSDEIVERWTNLEGRAHTLWTTLAPGNDYRFTIALRTNGLTSPSIIDEKRIAILAGTELAAVDGALAALDELATDRGQPGSAGPSGGGRRRYRPEYDVLRARLLESYGLLADAEAVWTGLAILYPRRAELFQYALRLHRKSHAPPR